MEAIKTTKTAPGQLWALPRVEEEVGLKRSSIYAMVREGRFPPPIKISRRVSRWSETAVKGWVADRVEEGGSYGR